MLGMRLGCTPQPSTSDSERIPRKSDRVCPDRPCCALEPYLSGQPRLIARARWPAVVRSRGINAPRSPLPTQGPGATLRQGVALHPLASADRRWFACAVERWTGRCWTTATHCSEQRYPMWVQGHALVASARRRWFAGAAERWPARWWTTATHCSEQRYPLWVQGHALVKGRALRGGTSWVASYDC